jgi:GSH-dependent disulfide-bond oxidoreductase
MLELYHWEPNTAFLKSLIALKEKGLDFTSHYVDLLDFKVPRKYPALNDEARFSMEGEGPILVNGRAILSDSFFINLYLDDAFPEKSLQPADAVGRWRIQALGRFLGEVFAAAVSTLGCHAYLAPALKTRDRRDIDAFITKLATLELRQAWTAAANDDYSEDQLADSRRKVGVGVKRIEGSLQSSPWLVGDVFSIADIEAFALSNGLPKLAPDLVNKNACPRLIEWLERIHSRPAVKAALAMSKTGKPDECYAPGPEHSRWG